MDVKLNGNQEFSYLTDIGVFQTQRDAYYASDDTDTSTFGLGFFGLGWRDGFDTNRFVTANIVPFETDGTFPIEDTTSRVDFGVSFRKDKSIFLNSLAAENGDAEISINVSGGCTGVDKMKTVAGEFGVGEVGVKLIILNYPGQQKGPTGRQNLIIQLQILQVQQRAVIFQQHIQNA